MSTDRQGDRLTDAEADAARRWFAGDKSAWPEVEASIRRLVELAAADEADDA